MHHCDVPGGVLATGPVWKEDVSWLPSGTREEVLAFLRGPYPCCNCRGMEHVAHGVVAAYSGAVGSTAQSMIT